MNGYYSSKAFKEKQRKMKTLIIRGCRIDDERQNTNNLYAHGELEDICGYDLVTAFKWGVFMNDVEEGIYDAKFICPDNTVVKAKAFVWCADVICNRRVMKGLVVKVGDDEHMKDAQEKYERKEWFI